MRVNRTYLRRPSGSNGQPSPAPEGMSAPAGERQRTGRSRRRRSVRIGRTMMAAALASTMSVACSVNSTPHPVNITPQARDLKQRVDHSKYFSGCGVPAAPSAGAEATINCQARQRGITVSASSFKVTGQAIPFSAAIISEESSGINKFLQSTIPASLPAIPNGAGAFSVAPCTPQGAVGCPNVAYSGFWGSPDLVIGRLYCYKHNRSYYIVWTFDNDSYEAAFSEDFVVVASSHRLTSLVLWWRQTPV